MEGRPLKALLAVLLLLTGTSLAQCPLGYTPDQACPGESPTCILFTDADASGFCDNPVPAEAEEDEQVVISPDTVIVPEETPEPVLDPPPDPLPEEVTEPDHVTVETPEEIQEQILEQIEEETEEPVLEVQAEVELVPCPFRFTPPEACPEEAPKCLLFRDPDCNGFCDNPYLTVVDTCIVNPDTILVCVEDIDCPLGLTPEEACPEDNPLCSLYLDYDLSGFCDNPDSLPEAAAAGGGWEHLGCPLDLAPDQACLHSMPLCPHWYGVTEGDDCADPLGGERRLWTVFMALIILLPVSRVLSRRLKGRRISERMARQKAHSVIRAVSLMVLGIAVQGCYCPLGTFQYLFIPGGLAFLGILGVAILALPIIQATVCGRVFCAWVCPMGGLQEFLYRIHVPGQFSPKGRIHRLLLWLKYVILVALVAGLLLVPSARAGRWEAFFCRYDPFHTVFMLFVSGSLIWAGVMILLSIFIRRFFCKYLCFYGALLSVFNRARLLHRFRKRPIPTREVTEIDSDEEFER